MDELSGLNRELLDPDEWMRKQDERIAKLREQGERMSTDLAGARIEASDRGELVNLAVNPSGALLSVSLSPRALNLTATQLSELIMSVYRDAQRRGSERMMDIMSEHLGADSQSMDFVRSVVPRPESEDGDDGDTDAWRYNR
ncbi:hypothetical protein Afil01_10910 [Actinorhabdospora filicis]|uniref:YbaB/EbfC DNA-binding family protein n=1 Tax=Actinorhabdospora filicis TaxID=1785913 RepID=A0A9W6SIS8_9ACTN|nr:YbaB/EbfC family nucleoid-associated protein [Actinorhabdospora filicis]GLZ76284.1 hypothetical protein Afil01_10910 [Actinorhabdospora filicis]